MLHTVKMSRKCIAMPTVDIIVQLNLNFFNVYFVATFKNQEKKI